MISVTERAKQELKRILVDNVDNPLAGLRLTSDESGQLGLSIDVETKDDQVVKHDNAKVLIVENNLADSLSKVTIDVKDTQEGPKLVITENS